MRKTSVKRRRRSSGRCVMWCGASWAMRPGPSRPSDSTSPGTSSKDLCSRLSGAQREGRNFFSAA
uniref:Uncharacterized protein n=1 Tax=Anguilla anguilla TaxID=7936 RepID=A0A0E9RYQ9_ANGAN